MKYRVGLNMNSDRFVGAGAWIDPQMPEHPGEHEQGSISSRSSGDETDS